MEDRLLTVYFCLKLLGFRLRSAVSGIQSPKLARVRTQISGFLLSESEVGSGSDSDQRFPVF